MRLERYLISAFGLLITAAASTGAQAACLRVDDDPQIAVSAVEEQRLASIGLDRAAIFRSMKDTSVPETEGCWAGAAGDFDGQIISLGLAQWNFGQDSLQDLLRRFRAKYPTQQLFEAEVRGIAPVYGMLLFAPGCITKPIAATCKDSMLAHQRRHGVVDEEVAAEFNALFETLPMRQVQTDVFVRLLGGVHDSLARLFPNQTVSGMQVKWAIDSKVQLGFAGSDDAARVRARFAKLPPDQQTSSLRRMIDWYSALALSIDQQGARDDAPWNVEQWTCVLNHGVSPEQADLLNLTFIRSRIAKTKAGYYQALAFQRRAKIIFGVGSVAQRRDGQCRN